MDVSIKIKDPILRAFLNGLFEKHEDGYRATLNNLTGSAIIALVQESPFPPKEDKDPEKVKFYLPNSHCTSRFRYKFLEADKYAQEKICAVLRNEFNVLFIEYCTELRILGFDQKDIISMFITEYKMDDLFDGDIETLKKRYYRKELEVINNFQKKLTSKAYYARRKISRKAAETYKIAVGNL